jgi:hypothetical protein
MRGGAPLEPHLTRSKCRGTGIEFLAQGQLRAATPSDFEAAIRGLTGDDLKLFVLKNLDLYVNRAQYQQFFGSAMDNFFAACKSLSDGSDRLAFVIRDAFARASVNLAPEDAAREPPAVEEKQS